MPDYPYYDRDLSWISFNYRVLMEARNQSVPLLERLRFAAIYSSNLDEFVRVRVASIRSIQEIDKQKITESAGVEPGLLTDIRATLRSHLQDYGAVLEDILARFKEKGIHLGAFLDMLSEEQKAEISYHFRSRILAYLRPHVFGVSGVEPFLNNQQLYLGLRLEKGGKEYFAYVNIPSDVLPRFQFIPGADGQYYFVYLDDIVRDNVGLVFQGYTVLECKSVKLNKDADLHIDDEYSGDLVEKIEKQIQKRNLGTPARFLYDKSMSMEMVNYFTMAFNLKESDLVAGGRYHNLNDYFQIFNPSKHDLEYEKLAPLRSKQIDEYPSILEAMEQGDRLLHFPYQTYDYVLQFFSAAAVDPDVEEIYVTFYRMAKDSVIGEALISAANNGKKVVVFMEVKARFDEENNLLWSSRMKAAGIKIIYSIPGLKVHAKVALVRKKEKSYGFFGTGNLNEKTARIYCDYGLLSCDEVMTNELYQVFRFLHKKKQPEELSQLIVSQFNAIPTFTNLIDREIALAKEGKKGKLIVKVNNLEESHMIAKLYEAAEAGVDVTVLARSICCLVPDTFGIRVVRLVDRYLEHARVFYFQNDGNEEVYMGSSDWMSRNLHRRVEVTFPVKDPSLRQEILTVVKLQLADNTNAVALSKDMENVPVPEGNPKVNAQRDTYLQVKEWND